MKLLFPQRKRDWQTCGWIHPFNFEVTGLLRSGENSIVVKVDNKRMLEGVPTMNTDWWNYGGITRQVNVMKHPLRLFAITTFS